MSPYPNLPRIAEQDSMMYMFINEIFEAIEMDSPPPPIADMSHIMAWVVKTQNAIEISHMILVKSPPTEEEFFEFCAELMTDPDFGIPPEVFSRWVPWITRRRLYENK